MAKRKKKKKKAKVSAPKVPRIRLGMNVKRLNMDDGTSADDPHNAEHNPLLLKGVKYELAANGDNIRCTRLYANGKQCKHWSKPGYILCARHAGSNAAGSGHGNGQTTARGARYRFNTERFDEFYAQTLNNPEWLSLNQEVALSRTAAQMLLELAQKRIKAAEELDEKDPKEAALKRQSILVCAATLQEMAENVSDIVDKAAKIQKTLERTIEIEHIDVWLEQVAGILNQEIEDTDVLTKIILRLRGSEAPTDGVRRIADWPKGSMERASIEEARRFALERIEKAASTNVASEVPDA